MTVASRLRAPLGAALVCAATIVGSAGAQESPLVAGSLGAQAIPLFTYAAPSAMGRRISEGYLSQPVILGDAGLGWASASVMLNLEGLTLRRGEATTGAWGEGYVDRRHPHAYLHEAMLGVEGSAMKTAALGPRPAMLSGSVFAGRGFVPFGSDDPMVRPFVKYPVNHHLAQILERLVTVVAGRAGPLLGELAAFNGDEPLDASTPPLVDRFGDSWAARATLLPSWFVPVLGDAELSASYARVKSPEYRDGFGMDQRKVHAGARAQRDVRGTATYALLEWAQTQDVDRGRPLYTFSSVLGEAAACRSQFALAFRAEQSERPEEERLPNLFRSPRPATDLSILGVTKWTTLTANLTVAAPSGWPVRAAPFVEVARVYGARSSLAAFDPSSFYRATSMWMISTGVRLGFGHAHSRMGRYGAARTGASDAHAMHAASSSATVQSPTLDLCGR
jgi:hypothetical protein